MSLSDRLAQRPRVAFKARTVFGTTGVILALSFVLWTWGLAHRFAASGNAWAIGSTLALVALVAGLVAFRYPAFQRTAQRHEVIACDSVLWGVQAVGVVLALVL